MLIGNQDDFFLPLLLLLPSSLEVLEVSMFFVVSIVEYSLVCADAIVGLTLLDDARDDDDDHAYAKLPLLMDRHPINIAIITAILDAEAGIGSSAIIAGCTKCLLLSEDSDYETISLMGGLFLAVGWIGCAMCVTSSRMEGSAPFLLKESFPPLSHSHSLPASHPPCHAH